MNINLKKGISTLLAVGAITTSLVGTAAFASESKTTHGGSEVISSKAQAGLTSGNMAGGYWIRGKSGNEVVSKYKHYTKEGHASVINGNGDDDYGNWESPGSYSYAHADWTFWGTNKTYYDFR